MRNISDLQIEDANGAPLPETIDRFERSFGVRLPAGYVEFLRVANGASLNLSQFEYPTSSGRIGTGNISTVFHLTDDMTDEYSVWENTLFLRRVFDEIGFSTSVVAIGETAGGDAIYLDFGVEPASVRILYRTSGNSCPLIAPSFEEFVDGLTPPS